MSLIRNGTRANLPEVGLEGKVREDKYEGTLVSCLLHPQMLLSLFFGLLQSLVISVPYPRVMADPKQQFLPLAGAEGLGKAGQDSRGCHQPSVIAVPGGKGL